MKYRAANLDRPQYLWSHRDWRVFRASCAPTKRQQILTIEVVKAVRSGKRVEDIAVVGKISKAYVYEILATEELRDKFRMDRFFDKRRNLGRPIDMGGPRDVWIED